jgi:DNA-binding PadR family transcriptional regulator
MYRRGFPHLRPWRETPFQKGYLKYIILDLIKEKPRYGYEIIRALEEQSQGIYAPSAGVVYPTLQMLEEMGLITAELIEGKRVYTITGAGHEFLVKEGNQTEKVKGHARNRWDSANMGEKRKFMNQVRELWVLIEQEFDDTTTEKKARIKKILDSAYNEIRTLVR